MSRLFRGKTLYAGIVWAVILVCAASAAPQVKKLEVVTDKAELRLDPDERSPIVVTLSKGAVVTLASAMRFRTNWFYVYFISPDSGKTRSGYVLDASVQKLYSDLKIVDLTASAGDALPEDLDLGEDYRPLTEWSADRSRVIASEGRPLRQRREGALEIVGYERRIMARNCLVEYVLGDDGLRSVRCTLLDNYSDKNRYIADYVKIKEFLVTKIGDPSADNVVWQDASLKADSARWGTALGRGDLEFRSQWEIPGAELLMTLAGRESGVAFGAEIHGLKIKTASH
ncbi:MAG: hypothetical protein ACYDH0_05245 [Candidatus Aminicenantales bacterium]